jgi:hypothetical protein
LLYAYLGRCTWLRLLQLRLQNCLQQSFSYQVCLHQDSRMVILFQQAVLHKCILLYITAQCSGTGLNTSAQAYFCLLQSYWRSSPMLDPSWFCRICMHSLKLAVAFLAPAKGLISTWLSLPCFVGETCSRMFLFDTNSCQWQRTRDAGRQAVSIQLQMAMQPLTMHLSEVV